MKAVKTIDNLAAGLVLVGAINWGIKGATRRDAVARVARPQSNVTRGIYTGIGLAAIYQLGRAFGPKTRDEKRLMKLEKYYDQMEGYRQRLAKLEDYGSSARQMMQQHLGKIRSR